MASGEENGRLLLRDWLEVELPDGSVVKLRPGPYGKGISVVPVAPARRDKATGVSNGKRGRKPRASTVKLRARLEKDAKAGRVKDAKDYVKWMIGIDETISLAVARQVVYRERKLHV